MDKNKYLPIGSVVLLKDGKKRLMIYGRKMKDIESEKEYDYIGCLYPEGNLKSDASFLFNDNQIERIYFIGLQDREEDDFCKNVLLN